MNPKTMDEESAAGIASHSLTSLAALHITFSLTPSAARFERA